MSNVIATLGDIPFITYQNDFTAFTSASGYNFALQSKLSAKPTLQSVGDELDQVEFDLFLHIDQINVEDAISQIRQAAEDKLALPLVFSNIYRGNYVITDQAITILSVSNINNQSRVNLAEVRVRLLEDASIDRRSRNTFSAININPFEFIG